MYHVANNQLPDAGAARSPLEVADVSLCDAAKTLHCVLDNFESRLGRVLRLVPPQPPQPPQPAVPMQSVAPACSELVARLTDTRGLVERAEERLRELMERLDV